MTAGRCRNGARRTTAGSHSTPIQVGRPDLVIAAVNNPIATAVRGTSIQVSRDRGQNPTSFNATATFRVQYYLSLDGLKNGGDRLPHRLSDRGRAGGRRVLAGDDLGDDPGRHSHRRLLLLVCADDTFLVMENNEDQQLPRLGGDAAGNSLEARRRKPVER